MMDVEILGGSVPEGCGVVKDERSLARRLGELCGHGWGSYLDVFRLMLAKVEDELRGIGWFVVEGGESDAGLHSRINRLYLDGIDRFGLDGMVGGEGWIVGLGSDVVTGGLGGEVVRSGLFKRLVLALSGVVVVGMVESGGDFFGRFYEEMVELGEKKGKGQYFTPEWLCKWVWEVCGDGLGVVKVIDPSVGSGRFLAVADDGKNALSGSDVDVGVLASAIVGIKLRNGIVGGFVLGDGLGVGLEVGSIGEGVREGRYDVVLSNPPYGLFGGRDEYGSSYELVDVIGGDASKSRFRLDMLFLERYCKLLRDGGRFGVVLPRSFIAMGGYRGVREWVLSKFRMIGVLAFTRDRFEYTDIETCVVLGEKRSKENLEEFELWYKKYSEDWVWCVSFIQNAVLSKKWGVGEGVELIEEIVEFLGVVFTGGVVEGDGVDKVLSLYGDEIKGLCEDKSWWVLPRVLCKLGEGYVWSDIGTYDNFVDVLEKSGVTESLKRQWKM